VAYTHTISRHGQTHTLNQPNTAAVLRNTDGQVCPFQYCS